MRHRRAYAALAVALCATACARKSALRPRGLEPTTTTSEALRSTLKPRRIAVVIGVDTYEDPAFPNLLHAVHDASALAKVFLSPRGGGFDSVVSLVQAPTRMEILNRLNQIKAGLRHEDVLVLYFSGHGTRVPDGTRWRRYLLGSDSTPSNLERTAIDLDALQRWFSNLAPQRKTLIVDACFNGLGKSVVRPEHRTAAPADITLAAPGVSLGAGESRLFATTPGRPSFEDDRLGHGVYTYYLLEALGWGFSEADRDKDGLVTAWEAHDHARAKTLDHTNQAQVPEASLRVVGIADVVLAGEPSARQERDRSLVYLYPDASHPMAGAALMVDGRSRGTLPGTVPLAPGRHHLAFVNGQKVLAEGYAVLSSGHAYRADVLSRSIQGPRHGISVRPSVFSSAPLQAVLGKAAVGVEFTLYAPPGRNQYAALSGGFATSPSRQNHPTPRSFGWLSLEGGLQTDWRRIRLRGGWALTGVWIPAAFPDGRGGSVDPRVVPGQAGWVFPATGPSVAAGWVFSEVWTLSASARPQFTWLDPTHDGSAQLVPWLSAGVGAEAVF